MALLDSNNSINWGNVGTATAAAAGNTLLGAASSALSNYQSYKYSKKLMDYQNEINVANWNMQNEYNSPAAQMQRYQAAGLNPNLIYGQGNNGNATSTPTVAQGSFKYQKLVDESSVMQSIFNALSTKADVQLKQSQVHLTDAKFMEESFKASLQQEYAEAITQYCEDISGTKSTAHTWDEERAKRLRASPWYKDCEKRKVSTDQALQILKNLTTQGNILGHQERMLNYQANNQESLDDMLNWDSMTIGKFIRAVYFLLTSGNALFSPISSKVQ